MKRRILGSGLVLLFIFSLWVATRTESSEVVEVWKITSLNWEPYSSAEMTNQGNAVQALRELLKAHGVELQVEYYPWSRARKVARGAGYVGYFPAWPNEVDPGFLASEPVLYSHLAVLSTPATPVVLNSLESIVSQYRTGYVSTYDYPDYIRSTLDKHPANTRQTMTDLLLLKMLVGQRFDVAIADPLVIEYLAEKHGLQEAQVVLELEHEPLVLAFRDEPANKARLERLNKMLRAANSPSGGVGQAPH